jgi:hypothetical protein
MHIYTEILLYSLLVVHVLSIGINIGKPNSRLLDFFTSLFLSILISIGIYLG